MGEKYISNISHAESNCYLLTITVVSSNREATLKSFETLNLHGALESLGNNRIDCIYSTIYNNCHRFITRLCKKGHANLAENNKNRSQSILNFVLLCFSYFLDD